MSKIEIANETRRFFVREIPRAAEKRLSKVLRGFWIAALVASLSITVWQLEEVVVRYDEYRADTTMREKLHESVFSCVTVSATNRRRRTARFRITERSFRKTSKHSKHYSIWFLIRRFFIII